LIPLLISAFGVKDRAVALSRADKRVDWLGGFSFTAGFVLLFFAISQARAARNGWGTDCTCNVLDELGQVTLKSMTLICRLPLVTDIIATLVLSLVLVGCAFLWDSYLERKTGYPPILRPSILTRRKGKLTLLCFVIVSPFAALLDAHLTVNPTQFCCLGAHNGLIYNVTIYYQRVLQLTPSQTAVSVSLGSFLPLI
jgi:hypothetical protein